MKLRDLAGAINRAKAVYVWCPYALGVGTYVQTTKVYAKEIITNAKADGVKDIPADEEEGELCIGEDIVSEDAKPGDPKPGREEEE